MKTGRKVERPIWVSQIVWFKIEAEIAARKEKETFHPIKVPIHLFRLEGVNLDGKK